MIYKVDLGSFNGVDHNYIHIDLSKLLMLRIKEDKFTIQLYFQLMDKPVEIWPCGLTSQVIHDDILDKWVQLPLHKI